MRLVVMKFGGTSVGDIARIRQVAALIANTRKADRVIVVVSAMSGETARLAKLCKMLSDSAEDSRESDAVLATGEQITAPLMAAALHELATPACSLAGWQVPITTDSQHGSARIQSIGKTVLSRLLQDGVVPVVSGFQGIAPDGSITTIGRGGSDLSAVAIAATLQADRCDIYTDVEGIYTADPRVVSDARRIDRICYDEMLEMASLGSKVLQARSVQLANRFCVPLRVASTFRPGPGTLLVQKDSDMEDVVVNGVVCSLFEARISLSTVPDRPGLAATIFGHLAEIGVNVDMIVQTASSDGRFTDMTFTLPRSRLAQSEKLLQELREKIGHRNVTSDARVSKVSIVGGGMRSHPGVAARMFRILADEQINMNAISTSEIRISVLIDEAAADQAVQALHAGFGLQTDRLITEDAHDGV